MLPCKRPHESLQGSGHEWIDYDTIINRRRLFSTDTGPQHCRGEGKVPLLSLEGLHHLHIFIFVLAIVHVVFSVTTMILGGARIRQWKSWEDYARRTSDETLRLQIDQFFNKHAQGYWRKAAVVSWLRSFFKQFYGSVAKFDYLALRQGFIKEHFPNNPDFNFHNYITGTLEVDFRKVIGISLKQILLLVGAKLEHIITRLGQESVAKGDPTKRVKPSDEYFWFGRPAIVLDLLHFTLFQNSFEIAFFFWIWSTYGFDSCIMEKIAYIIPRLVMGIIVQVLCSYSTLPLYTLVTQMGSRCKIEKFDEKVESPPLLQRMTKESNQNSQIGEQAIIMMEDLPISSTIELQPIIQSPLERHNTFNTQ
ncbi:MLO-like protein 13-like [Trifolium pratense]|uniref:MLO-like protein 13-like n=1 Tax=Trifolium pratense TaxID=57577 RepID=A0A2K3N1Z1_TRIPR|nr:MLO-like protein 13-like [Trifolium pratense]